MAEHEGVVGAQIGESLPLVARHAAEDRALAVHDLVMRQRQNEILGESVMQAEQDLAVMMAAMDRVLRHVVESVVHPAHVPFVAEAKPAPVNRTRHLRPGGRFLRGRGARAESCSKTSVLVRRRKSTASMFSRPPCLFGIQAFAGRL